LQSFQSNLWAKGGEVEYSQQLQLCSASLLEVFDHAKLRHDTQIVPQCTLLVHVIVKKTIITTTIIIRQKDANTQCKQYILMFDSVD